MNVHTWIRAAQTDGGPPERWERLGRVAADLLSPAPVVRLDSPPERQIREALRHLPPGGWLLVVGQDDVPEVRRALLDVLDCVDAETIYVCDGPGFCLVRPVSRA